MHFRKQKLVRKQYASITGQADTDAAEGGAGTDDEGKKQKAQSLPKILKARLQKLIEKTDDK
jgi:hypothetical protein